jgi:hypothetical protein
MAVQPTKDSKAALPSNSTSEIEVIAAKEPAIEPPAVGLVATGLAVAVLLLGAEVATVAAGLVKAAVGPLDSNSDPATSGPESAAVVMCQRLVVERGIERVQSTTVHLLAVVLEQNAGAELLRRYCHTIVENEERSTDHLGRVFAEGHYVALPLAVVLTWREVLIRFHSDLVDPEEVADSAAPGRGWPSLAAPV